MSNSVYRRCGCRDSNGKQYSAENSCPRMTDARHGSWWYYLSHGTEADPRRPGKRRRRQLRKSGFRTKREAQAALAKVRAEMDAGTYTAPSKITVADDATEWLERRQ
jgi:hypothetical protein